LVAELEEAFEAAVDLTASSARLSVALRRADDLNMNQLNEVVHARDLYMHIEATKAAVAAALLDHTQLATLLDTAREHGFDETPEVQRCLKLRLLLPALEAAIANGDEIGIRSCVDSFALLGLPDIHEIMEAKRLLKDMQRARASLEETLAILPSYPSITVRCDKLRTALQVCEGYHLNDAVVKRARKTLEVLDSSRVASHSCLRP
jgi:cell fate (sporulation/competence/biofilm development) regulator YlbF (YheA/YmcA/DUF963 family)